MAVSTLLLFSGDAKVERSVEFALKFFETDYRLRHGGEVCARKPIGLDPGETIAGLLVDADSAGGPDPTTLVSLCDLQHRFPLAPMLALVSDPHPAQIVRILGCGAYGVCGKHCAVDELSAAIRLVTARRVFVPVRQIRKSGSEIQKPAGPRGRSMGLTDRQCDVYQLIHKGLSNKAIAYELGLSESTVKIHVNAIFHALGVSNRVAAINALTVAS